MRKRLNIITSVPLSEPVVSNRLFPFFDALAKKDITVRCICPASDFDHTLLPAHVVLDEVDVRLTKPGGFIKRGIREAWDVTTLLRYARGQHGRTTLVTIPSMFLAFLTPLLLRRHQVFIDVRDLTWEYLPDSRLCYRWAKNTFRWLFKKNINSFKLIAATNNTELRYIQALKPRIAPLHISNGIRQSQFDKLKQVDVSTETVFTVTYIGNVGLAQRLDTLVEAARALPDIAFRIIGTGIDKSRIRHLVAEYQLSNVLLTGRLPWDEVIHHYNASHVLYAQLAPEFSGAMPSKLYEYLATGKPIIYGGQGQALETLQQFESCYVIEPCQPDQLIPQLEALSDSLDTSYLSQRNKHRIKGNFIREEVSLRLAHEIRGHMT